MTMVIVIVAIIDLGDATRFDGDVTNGGHLT